MQNTIVAAYPDPENGGHITYVWSHGAEVWQENGEWKTRLIPHPFAVIEPKDTPYHSAEVAVDD